MENFQKLFFPWPFIHLIVPWKVEIHTKGSSGGLLNSGQTQQERTALNEPDSQMQIWQGLYQHLNCWLLSVTGDEQAELGKLSVEGGKNPQPVLNAKPN